MLVQIDSSHTILWPFILECIMCSIVKRSTGKRRDDCPKREEKPLILLHLHVSFTLIKNFIWPDQQKWRKRKTKSSNIYYTLHWQMPAYIVS